MTLRVSRIGSPDEPGLVLSALAENDLPTIRRWLAEPHIARVWATPEEGVAKIASHLSQAHVAPYLIVEDEQPVGYLQLYLANPDEFWSAHDLPRETYGLDLFIGPPQLVGRGLGTRAIRLAVRHLWALPDAARLHIDPSPDNAAAIHAYGKAGFVPVGEIETPDGRSLYMILDPRRGILGPSL